MFLSPAERSYFYDSLIQKPPIRPDGRTALQMRPLEAKTQFLPASNGSARIRMADGSECIVSVKLKVVLIAKESNLIECDIDVAGVRSDSNYVANLKYNLTSLYSKNFPTHKLHLTKKYAYKLFVDCVVISHMLHPLTLLTMAAYLALKSTKLPLLVSEVDDEEIEEQPTFSDDWELAQDLESFLKVELFQPPLIITFGVVGSNLLLDPTVQEELALDNGLLMGWHDGKVISPIFNHNLATNSNNVNFKGMSPKVVFEATAMGSRCCPQVVEALDKLVENDENDHDGTMF